MISYADYAIAMVDEALSGNHIRQRISVLPLIYSRGAYPKAACHLLLSHVFTFSVFPDHFTYLHNDNHPSMISASAFAVFILSAL